jgi:hypothetical protein
LDFCFGIGLPFHLTNPYVGIKEYIYIYVKIYPNRSPFSPQKNLFKRESIEEIVPEEAMKKERA